MSKIDVDKEFAIPIRYSIQSEPKQIDFPDGITAREGALHLVPGVVKFVGKKELVYLKEKTKCSFEVLAVKKIVKKDTPEATEKSPEATEKLPEATEKLPEATEKLPEATEKSIEEPTSAEKKKASRDKKNK